MIEDDVETGANTMVDRGSLGVARIASGAKIDNLVQIADNVKIGRGVVIAAQRRERRRHRLKAGVLPGKIVRRGEVYWAFRFGRLPEMKARIEALERALEELSRPAKHLTAEARRAQRKK